MNDSCLRNALVQAQSATYLTNPNPRVGCLIANGSGHVIGQGHTQRAGGPHAEVMALRDAAEKGHSVEGATAYVTLEPCSHHGRTGPCCDALIQAGVKKVVATNLDPNPLVAGNGFARLRAAGVEVEVLAPDHPLAVQSRELNIGFFSRMIRKTPWVRMKVAASLDGTTALDNGASQWITGPDARADGHAWRARSCAILTGIGTVLADRPRLDVRLVDTPRQPHLVVVDSHLDTPPDAPFFIAGRAVFIYTNGQNASKRAALEQAGATIVDMPERNSQGALTGKVDLAAMMLDLGRREINELHVEAGFKLNGSLVRAGLVDEFVMYFAPKLLGQGAGMFHIGPLKELGQGVELEFKSTDMVGPDLRIVARVLGRDRF
ncbi:MAG: bifunctional diaminohydroxyphosphoribosylaminopyrimidine deaminase/5-amino-6-(5-phosphoribosylamino)uracil reductase RibD [Rhodoferax sp.]|uniref:bifunctional diaminohydroxyphosphoribosylaminopyrimidine deaminase/5-amino-6-(5-phosphoribosylamino)uracil reductase RibD n=1 Tax=Rhodoferax sp. TaxID=50421 RepID=UPI002ACD4DAA|nr:bifunctional diaminohydroxyphosphoribosylaminopyrimidine deaminase/5-amino-6-(5-phosphoribosylamino)uracil reductase RibD [Rhodoferax sp.]MDZ7892000.1 bifunctional diaminohydroxyphosphoribosylaminopyrimidine deaminase/5-amino-6-(5-phosphoribosylamino)uracil reductase RibD [Rhodoferax sp.]